MTWLKILRINTFHDSFHDEDNREPSVARRALRIAVLAFLAAYWTKVALSSSGTTQEDLLVYESPEGLKMTLTESFPSLFLMIHKYAGLLLLPLCVVQKWLVPLMCVDKKSGRPFDAETARKLHVVVGYATLGGIGYMAYAGFSLRAYSTFSGFNTAMLFFVAPWVVFLVLVPLSVWKRWYVVHSIVGNCVFKAAVAVPLARVIGASLQRINAFGDLGAAYYTGIAASAVIIGAWSLWDLRKTLRLWAKPSKAL